MYENRKATRSSGSFDNHSFNATNVNNRRIGFDYNRNMQQRQCKKCGSDYMKFSFQGLCQDCLQKGEYIVREHPATAQRASGGQR